LIDVEDRVFTQHRDQASFGFVAIAVSHLQLLDEIDLGAVLALAHMAACFQRLLEGEKARRCPASIAREPEQDDVAARVRSVADGVLGDVLARRYGPGLHPGCRAALQIGNDACRYFSIEITSHSALLQLSL